jgi:hypothetical protein
MDLPMRRICLIYTHIYINIYNMDLCRDNEETSEMIEGLCKGEGERERGREGERERGRIRRERLRGVHTSPYARTQR